MGLDKNAIAELSAYRTETTKLIPNSKKPSKNFQLESSKIISYCDGVLLYNDRFTVTNVLPYSVELEKNSATDPAFFRPTPYVATNDFDFDYFEFLFSSPDTSLLTDLQLRILPDGADTAKYYYMSVFTRIPYGLPPNTPIRIRIHKSELTVTATPPPAGLTLTAGGYVELRVSGALGLKVKLINGLMGVKVKTPVMIQFDDGNLTVYEKAFPLMKARGIVGTFNVVTSFIGTEGNCSWEQLREMQDAGWTIASHSIDHVDHTLITEAQVITNLETAQQILASHGFTGSTLFTPPFNTFSTTLENRVRHVIRSRKYGDRWQDPIGFRQNVVGIQAKSVSDIDSPTILLADYALALASGKYFSACWHQFVDEVPTYQYAYQTSVFEEFLDLLVANDAYCCNAETFVDRCLITSRLV